MIDSLSFVMTCLRHTRGSSQHLNTAGSRLTIAQVIAVLIQWRIRPDDASVEAFKDWWTTNARIADSSRLFGEFLCRPAPAESLPFRSNDLRAPDDSYRTFVNVGIWESLEAFHAQVGQYFRDDAEPLPFEFEMRRRTILRPEAARRGEWIPTDGT